MDEIYAVGCFLSLFLHAHYPSEISKRKANWLIKLMVLQAYISLIMNALL
jgi:hypothetical protein